ncbi:hypothetical protein JHK82_018219 [Glycine max]|uniref:ATP-dependent zinc metalloprotease FTSH 6, chloroplastic n=1 Tax=Glycine soja TaxID=3848 RepID=A0A0B2RQF4_GLYSO|nr:hypothetical protein JHK85_018645 [Glycine max]KAG5142524.1 hypothetical protein JHK82_018219 [Glycine max]KHN34523.1 ATP-dependent zinc metalloprotease FTSH 6, chloroplastic [Glycine soja]
MSSSELETTPLALKEKGLPLIVVPTICKDKNSPFGDEVVCHKNGLAYASLSMAIGYTYAWSITFNVVRIYSPKISNEVKVDETTENSKSATENDPENLLKCPCGALVMAEDIAKPNGGMDQPDFECKVPNGQAKVPERLNIMKILAHKINNMKTLIAPSTMAAIMGLTIGVVPQFRKLLVADNALFHVVQDTITMLGDASVPAMVLLLGANLVKGLKGLGQQLPLIVGIIMVKFLALPAIGIGIVKGAAHFNLIHHDPLYQFVLLLQYALPPAIVVTFSSSAHSHPFFRELSINPRGISSSSTSFWFVFLPRGASSFPASGSPSSAHSRSSASFRCSVLHRGKPIVPYVVPYECHFASIVRFLGVVGRDVFIGLLLYYFIDEIDVVGRLKGTGIGGGNDEREQTLNHLLTEMKKLDKDVSLSVISMRTSEFSGEDPSLISKNQLLARIVGGLRERAEEEVIFSETEITTGAAVDLQQITQIARQMVTKFGMSEIGPWALIDPAVQGHHVVLRMLARN